MAGEPNAPNPDWAALVVMAVGLRYALLSNSTSHSPPYVPPPLTRTASSILNIFAILVLEIFRQSALASALLASVQQLAVLAYWYLPPGQSKSPPP